MLGDDVTIKDELYINGASVLPHKSVSRINFPGLPKLTMTPSYQISSSITEPRIVMCESGVFESLNIDHRLTWKQRHPSFARVHAIIPSTLLSMTHMRRKEDAQHVLLLPMASFDHTYYTFRGLFGSHPHASYHRSQFLTLLLATLDARCGIGCANSEHA